MTCIFPHGRERRASLPRRRTRVPARAAFLCCALVTGVLRAAVGRPVEAGSAAGQTAGNGTEIIPTVAGRTLAGEQVRLPGDLAPLAGQQGGGRTAVLIVGFGRGASSSARDWGLRLGADLAGSQTTVYFEMPVLAGVPRLLRGAVLRSMAGSVSERGRHHFLPILEQEAAWRQVVAFKGDEVPYVLVVDEHGEVRWRTSGTLSEQTYAQLREHLPPATH